jgi:SAM-dependent methyltransferase
MGKKPRAPADLTIAAYDRMADAYFEETRDRDLHADYDLFFRHLAGPMPFNLLDLGCGPGRDLRYFTSLGHQAIGIDGSMRFVNMARSYSGCRVLHQDLRKLRLPRAQFDGAFASASLFHIPPADLPKTLCAIHAALKPGGVLVCINPRGQDEQGWMDDRFCVYYRPSTWRKLMRAAGFVELARGYRPRGLPRARQEWLTTAWRKPS